MSSSKASAISVQGLGKKYLLGQTHQGNLRERISGLFRRGDAPAERRDFWALRDVDFELEEGSALGIVGGNGAGKSTLLKVLSRITLPTTGRAVVRGRLASLLEVGTGFHPELTGRENVFLNATILGMRKAEVARKFDEIVAFSGVEQFIDTPVKRYSSGMYVRLAFAVAEHLEPDVLIVDEVLAVGDVGFQKRCLGKMGDAARDGRTVLFVSHNMAAVQKLCKHAVWLDHGRVRMRGDAEQVVAAYVQSATEADLARPGLPPGALYRAPESPGRDDEVTAVDMLDDAGRPLLALRTWDAVRFRIAFRACRAYRSFSAVLKVSTPEGVPLLLTSTTPDHTLPISIESGLHVVECRFERFPLSAGDYVIGAGLAIPGVEYVWRNESLAPLSVASRDVFGSALPPASNRYLVVAPHTWSVPAAVSTDA
jgi:lipopolysaccharide transport system ATP-binding protein